MLMEERGRRALPVSLDAAEHAEGEVLGAAAPTPAAGALLLHASSNHSCSSGGKISSPAPGTGLEKR